MARIISPSGKGGSGAPSGVYANIAALEAAYPAGNKNVYVTLDDGNWNYWNGTAWAAGGVYLSDPTVVNNLTDGGVDVPLSAEMGKELDGKITNLATNAATATDGQILASNGDGTSEFITQNSDLIHVLDAAGNFASDNVEGALTELVTNKVSKVPSANLGNIIIVGEDGSMIDSGMPLDSVVESWADVQRIVRAGMAPKIFTIGEQFQCNRGSDVLTWDIIGFDHDIPADSSYTHSMTLQMHDCYKNIQYDATEALYYAENELPEGTYNFTLLAGYDVAYGGGKTFYFTLTHPVPAGGQIMFPWGNQIQSDTVKISTYASNTTTTAIESNISVTEGSEGTALTSLGTCNHTHRIRYGSNNWLESAMRQWLNSDAAAGGAWIPKTVFDRPPSWLATEAGFLYNIDADFLAVVGEVTKRTAKNTVNDGGDFIDMVEKIFLPSRGEVGGADEGGINEGVPYEYYNSMLINGVRNDNAIEARIKYLSITSRRWWLRSPDVSFASYVRSVYTSGAMSYSYAYDAGGAAPACNII